MRTSASKATSVAGMPDGVAVMGMLAAAAIVIFVVTLLFAVIRRFARQEAPEITAPVVTPRVLPGG